MNKSNPSDTVTGLVDAINQGNLQAAIARYEIGACFVVQPGTVAVGTEALSQAIARMIALKPVLTTQTCQTIQTGEVALYCSQWQLTGTAVDGSPVHMTGSSSDVLRRQADGHWLIAIDNPWGPAVLG